MIAKLPLNEIMRLKALHDLAILDTPREQSFDDIALVAMQLCNVPTAVVSLVDKDRQWFKSCLGLEASETPRDVAFCAHAILQPDDVLVIEDASKDVRFIDNGLVTGPPYIRFYAGAPLVDEQGYALGTLCVIDYQPNSLNDAQVTALKALARQVVQLLKLKATNQAIQQYSARMQLIANKVPALIGELNLDRRYTFANQNHQTWLDYRDSDCLGKTPQDIFPTSSHAALGEALNKSFTGERSSVEIMFDDGRVLDVNFFPNIEQENVVGVFEIATDITERKLHINALQEERERLQSIIDGTNIGTWEWNLLTNNVLINERWAKMLGYSTAELGPVTFDVWRDMVHPDDREVAYASLQKHLSGESKFHDCQFRMRKKNGDWHWLHAHGKTVSRTTEGKPEVVSGMHIDINDAKTVYERLKEQENLLSSLLSNFPGAAYRCVKENGWFIHYLSEAANDLTGYPASTFIGQPQRMFSDLIHVDDSLRVKAIVRQALSEHQPFTVEYRLRRADGQWRHVQEFGNAIFNDNNELVYLDGFIWDVQARVDSEHEKRLMTSKLSQLFEMAPIGILQVHSSGRFIDTNPEFSKLLGYSREELRGMSILGITPEEDRSKSQAAIDALIANGRFGPVEKNYVNKLGELVAVEISGSTINLNEKDDLSWWTLVKDIREQKRIDKMKSEFISTVSHELRTPLTSISGALGLIANGMLGEVPEKIKKILDIAFKNSQRLTLLINDLLDMEKLLAGKMSFDIRPQLVVPLVEQVIMENKAYAEKYHVRYRLENHVHQACIAVDAFRFQQVLNNFLSNAAKFSPENHEVVVRVDERFDVIRIAVIDHGAGIPAAFKTHIFQKFSQADSSNTRDKGGTGLGLAISKELVERMGGNIGFESELGQGSCFYVDFTKHTYQAQ